MSDACLRMKVQPLDSPVVKDKNFHIIWFISLIFGIQGLLMTVISLIDHNYWLVALNGFDCVLMFSAFIYLNISKKLNLFYIFTPLVVVCLEIVFLLKGGTEGFGIIWITAVPLFTLYLLPFNWFMILNAGLLVIQMICLWTPLSAYMYPFKASFALRFPLVFLFELFFALYIKYRIHKTEHELDYQKKLLLTEINQAALIQNSFLKRKDIDYSDWNIACKCVPMSGVSGDMFDFFSDGNRLNGLGIFDISGHGISSGIITLLAKNIIRNEFRADTKIPLSYTVEHINERYLEEKGSIDNYITGIILRICDNDGTIELVNAGHKLPFVYRKKTGTAELIPNSKEAVGAIGFRDLPYRYVSLFLSLESGDELFLYTDGIVDMRNKAGEEFGSERFVESICRHAGENVDTQLSLVFDDINAFANGMPLADDMSLIILQKK